MVGARSTHSCEINVTPLIDVLAEMEFNGIAIDPAVLKEQSGVLAVRIDELREKIHTEAGEGARCVCTAPV